MRGLGRGGRRPPSARRAPPRRRDWRLGSESHRQSCRVRACGSSGPCQSCAKSREPNIGAVKAVRVVRHGAPTDALEVQDIPVPDAGPGEVRIAVSAASLNFGDIARCRGTLASVQGQVPFTLGMDVCGVVDAAGAGAEEWLGRRVVAMTNQSFGGVAELALSSLTSVFDAPPELDDVEAAAFTLPFHTGYLALHRRARLIAGETLPVVGGGSAAGTAVTQPGTAAVARVRAVAGG